MKRDSNRRLGPWLRLLAGVLIGSIATGGIVLTALALADDNAPDQALGAPLFAEESETAGLDHEYDGEFGFFVGGGAAVFDCNSDRRQDLYLAGGENPAGIYINESSIGGSLAFSRLESQVTDLPAVTGAYPLDIDSDGETDLAVLRRGENVLLRGLGDCRFERANDIWGVDGGDSWTVAFSATWETGQELPTMVFGNYLALEEDVEGARQCADHRLVRPAAEGYGASTLLSPGWCTLSVLFSDWSGTGEIDLRMTNDRHYYSDGEEQLWRFEPGEPPRLYGREDGWERMQIWGMGIASYDITGDGIPEVFLTSQGDNKLQTLTGDQAQPSYDDIALQLGANVPRPFTGDVNRPSTAWHPEFDDVNNDGFIDLFVTKGNVEAMDGFATRDPNNLLLGRTDGTFVESAEEAGLLDFDRSRGAAVTDFNLDGMVDVLVVDRRERVKVWRNLGSGTLSGPEQMGNWVAVDLAQAPPNTDAIGSWVELKVGGELMRRELTVGGGHAGDQLGWIHFGLGSADRAEIKVTWPDGEEGAWIEVDANQFLIIDRREDNARPWVPLQD